MLSNTWKNSKEYTESGVVPAKTKNNGSKVPANSFYKSVHYVDSVVGPVKDMLLSIKERQSSSNYLGQRAHGYPGIVLLSILTLVSIALQPLYLAFAYLSYWPVKGLSKVTDNTDLENKTESLVDYSNMLSGKAEEHSFAIGYFINTILSCVVTAVIWTVALAITPLVWAVDKVASKFSETQVHDTGATAGAPPV